jgi:hypothetical protein
MLEDQVVKDPTITFRHIEIPPRSTMLLKKRLDRTVQCREAVLDKSTAGQVGGQQRDGADNENGSGHGANSLNLGGG